MLDTQDIQKLLEVITTKEDINRIEDRLSVVKDILSNLVTVTDRLVGRVEMLHQEYLVLKERDSR